MGWWRKFYFLSSASGGQEAFAMSGQKAFPALPDPPAPAPPAPAPVPPAPAPSPPEPIAPVLEVPARGGRLQYKTVKYIF